MRSATTGHTSRCCCVARPTELTTPRSRAEELNRLVDEARVTLDGAHKAREIAIPACRRVIRAAGASIRAVHRGEADVAASLAAESESALREAQSALAPWPVLAASGPLADAEKEYAEARLCAALIDGSALPSAAALGVSASAWLNGLAEAASELRRNCLDRLREGELARGEALLGAMDDVYSQLIAVDHPDAVTGGLRRTTDALRAVLERTRGDLTVTAVQARLQKALEEQGPDRR